MAKTIKLADMVLAPVARSYELAGLWSREHAMVAESEGGWVRVQPSGSAAGMWDAQVVCSGEISYSLPLDREVVGLWLDGSGFDPYQAEWRSAPITRLPPAEARPRITRADKNPTDLYRCFDRDGRLLYVGISLTTAYRMSQHRSVARWWDEVARVEIEKHPDRATALSAESAAIKSEEPAHNG